jgi:hypothetical protein
MTNLEIIESLKAVQNRTASKKQFRMVYVALNSIVGFPEAETICNMIDKNGLESTFTDVVYSRFSSVFYFKTGRYIIAK